MQSVADVQMSHATSEDVAGVVEGESRVGGDVCDFSPFEGDGVFDHFLDVVDVEECFFGLFEGDADEVEGEECGNVSRWGGAVDGSAVTHLKQERDTAAVVEVGVAEDDGVEVFDFELGAVEVGVGLLVLHGDVDAAVEEESAFGGLEEDAASADLTCAAEEGESDPFFLVVAFWAVVDAVADFIEEFFSVVIVLVEDASDVFDNF